MSNPDTDSSDMVATLRDYLQVAASFRNHEFQIQMIRNVAFSAFQIALFTVFAVAPQDSPSALALLVTVLGGAVSLLWRSYFLASRYWIQFWELRCREINDELVHVAGLNVDLFKGHPIGSEETPSPVTHGGRTLSYRRSAVDRVARIPDMVLVLWLLLAAATAYSILAAR